MRLGLTDKLVHSTVRIECTLTNGEQSSGTGFLFNFLQGTNQCVPAIVTNKHVIRDAARGIFHLTKSNPDGMPDLGNQVRVKLDDFARQWIGHPDDDVDLAIFPVGGIFNSCEAEGNPVFRAPLTKSLIPSRELLDEITAMEDVIMIGYPNGIWDSINNLPLIRRGITASPANIDYEGRKIFMIDAACFPGSSGSPVFLLNQGSYPTKSGNLVVGSRLALLGILYAGPQYTAKGEITVENIPTNTRPVPILRMPINLGYCIKAERIIELEPVLIELGIEVPEGYHC